MIAPRGLLHHLPAPGALLELGPPRECHEGRIVLVARVRDLVLFAGLAFVEGGAAGQAEALGAFGAFEVGDAFFVEEGVLAGERWAPRYVCLLIHGGVESKL